MTEWEGWGIAIYCVEECAGYVVGGVHLFIGQIFQKITMDTGV
uniref:Bm11007, isoform b n=2 Tax=Brugia TaxID=6278 RepID=A0A1I9G5C7_BRUMA|nr:Bm11007, isoform b [Brugia malayi]